MKVYQMQQEKLDVLTKQYQNAVVVNIQIIKLQKGLFGNIILKTKSDLKI